MNPDHSSAQERGREPAPSPQAAPWADLYHQELRWNDKLTQILDIARLLTSTLDSDAIIHRILQLTLRLIDEADGAALFLYDAGEDLLVPRQSVGFNWQHLSRIRLRPGESMSGKAFVQGHGLLFASRRETLHGSRNMRPVNRHHYLRAIPVPVNELRSCITVPLVHDNHRIGVLAVDNFQNPGQFDERDLELAEYMAVYAAVALRNAQQFEALQQESRRVAELHRVVREQNLQLRRAAQGHDHLIEGMLREETLAEMVRRIGQAVRAPVSARLGALEARWPGTGSGMEELPERSNPLPGLGINGEDGSGAGEAQGSRGIQASLVEMGGERVLFCPIVVWDERLGEIYARIQYVLDDDGRVQVARDPEPSADPAQRRILQQAATLLALRALQERATVQGERQSRNDFLRDLIARPDDERLAQRAHFLGIRADRAFVPVIVDLDHFGERLDAYRSEREIQAVKGELLHYTEQTFFGRLGRCREVAGPTVTFHQSDSVIGLIPFHDADAALAFERTLESHARDFQEDFRETWDRFTVTIAVGLPGRSLPEISACLAEAQRALQLMLHQGRSEAIVVVRRLGPLRLLLDRLESRDARELVWHTLAPLLDLPQEERSTYLHTLSVYVDENRRVKASARRLFIHTNTLHHRLHRIQEILGLDFDRFEDWTSVAMAVRLLPFANV